MGKLPNANDARVGVLVIPIPKTALLGLLSEVAEGVGNELYGGRGVRDEYQVEVFGVCPKEFERLQPDLVDDIAGQLGGRILRVRVPVQVRNHLLGEGIHYRLGVYGRPAVIEVDS